MEIDDLGGCSCVCKFGLNLTSNLLLRAPYPESPNSPGGNQLSSELRGIYRNSCRRHAITLDFLQVPIFHLNPAKNITEKRL